MTQELVSKIWEIYGDLQVANKKRKAVGMSEYPFTMDPNFPMGYSYNRLFDYLDVVSNAAVTANTEYDAYIKNHPHAIEEGYDINMKKTNQQLISKIWERYGELRVANKKRKTVGMSDYPFTMDPEFPIGYSYDKLIDYLDTISSAVATAKTEYDTYIKNNPHIMESGYDSNMVLAGLGLGLLLLIYFRRY
jgi:hypothetical protein